MQVTPYEKVQNKRIRQSSEASTNTKHKHSNKKKSRDGSNLGIRDNLYVPRSRGNASTVNGNPSETRTLQHTAYKTVYRYVQAKEKEAFPQIKGLWKARGRPK